MTSFRSLRAATLAAAAPVAALLLLAACDRPSDVPREAVPLSLGREANGTTATLATGQALVVRLDANATTGYGWTLADSAALAPVLTVERTGYTPDVPDASETPPRVGAGGVYALHLRAAAAGTTRLRLAYRRPFELATTAPADTFALVVAVAPR